MATRRRQSELGRSISGISAKQAAWRRQRYNAPAVNHYIATQLALGNWPYDLVWAGDVVLLALVDTYDFVGTT